MVWPPLTKKVNERDPFDHEWGGTDYRLLGRLKTGDIHSYIYYFSPES